MSQPLRKKAFSRAAKSFLYNDSIFLNKQEDLSSNLISKIITKKHLTKDFHSLKSNKSEWEKVMHSKRTEDKVKRQIILSIHQKTTNLHQNSQNT